MESGKNPEAGESDKGGKPDIPKLKVVRPGDSQRDLPDVPQISLEHIVSFARLAKASDRLHSEVEAIYDTALKDALQREIGEKTRKRMQDNRKWWKRKKYRIGFSFSYLGWQDKFAQAVLGKMEYPEKVLEIGPICHNAYLFQRRFSDACHVIKKLSSYLSKAYAQKEKSQPEEAEEQEGFFSKNEESKIDGQLSNIFGELENYNARTSEFVGNLPSLDEEADEDLGLEDTVSGFNSLLAEIAADPYDEQLKKKVEAILQRAEKILKKIDNCYDSSNKISNFNHLTDKWGSAGFAEYLEGMGFHIVRKTFKWAGEKAVYAWREIPKE